MSRIVLASRSAHRAALLTNAGVEIEIIAADVDERALEKPLLDSGMGGEDVAEVLARAKADDVSSKNPEDYVIGCDQTLTLEGKLLHKPADMEAAHRRLLALSGKTHALNSAVALAKGRQILWSHVEVSHITFRKLDPGFVGRHTSATGKGILTSVGAYQIEGLGLQLIEKIDGDYFSIIGLPLLALLDELRSHGLLDN